MEKYKFGSGMSKKDEIAKLQQDTGSVLDKTLTTLAEGITGLAASDKKELALSVGHIFQSLRKGQFLGQLIEEWKRLREKGRIKDDYQSSEQHFSCLQEMLEFLDHDSPDQVRFDVIKKIFLVAATDPETNRESVLPHQYMRICRGLSSGEVIVLSTTYNIAEKGYPDKMSGAQQWLEMVAKDSGLTHTGLVEIHEEELIKKMLLTRRFHGDRSGVAVSPHFRLTNIGYEICKYIDKYEEV